MGDSVWLGAFLPARFESDSGPAGIRARENVAMCLPARSAVLVSALKIRAVFTMVYAAVHTFHIFRKSTVFFKPYSTTNQRNTFGQHKSYRSSVKLGSLELLNGAREHRPKQKHVNKLTSAFVNLTALNKLTLSSLIVQYVRPSTLVTEASIGSCKYCAVTQLVISA